MKPFIPPTGELRRSQVITTFGPGAMVDLPDHSVLISGLDFWRGDRERVPEERLERWLQKRLGIPGLELYAPPIDHGESRPGVGIDVFQFPGWFLAQVEEKWTAPDGRVYRTRPMVRWDRLVKRGYLARDKKVKPVVPVRFVQACARGHLSDIDWYAFVRRDFQADQQGELWLDEGGAGNDIAEIYVRDADRGDRRRPLADATMKGVNILGMCAGRRPWLGDKAREACDQPNRFLSRSASYAYFPQKVAVISIPEADQRLRDAIDSVWIENLQYCEDESDIRKERRRERVAAALEGIPDADVWAEVSRRREKKPVVERSIKEVELDTLLQQHETLGEDRPEGDFFARSCPIGALPSAATGLVRRLVLVHRLREVVAQLGFTRFQANFPDIHGELDLDVKMATLAREPTWLPANQNRGEGIFIAFDDDAIAAWQARPAVKARGEALARGHAAWRARENLQPAPFPELRYVMLHSLSHLLITALALDCGYSASAIRERVYVGAKGCGILLYTGTSGSEGSLGGLVEMGKSIGRHLDRALELGRLCSNDPVCAQHQPADAHEERYLHGAACHGCVLIAETCCEQGNQLLDRALVIPTVETPDAAFFGANT